MRGGNKKAPPSQSQEEPSVTLGQMRIFLPKWCPSRESNPVCRLERPVCYPLQHRDKVRRVSSAEPYRPEWRTLGPSLEHLEKSRPDQDSHLKHRYLCLFPAATFTAGGVISHSPGHSKLPGFGFDAQAQRQPCRLIGSVPPFPVRCAKCPGSVNGPNQANYRVSQVFHSCFDAT